MGFISKNHAKNLLMNSPSGTFLLRFPETILGGIVIVYVLEGKYISKIIKVGLYWT